ncbi:sterol 3-beta-glucosyltransferase, glycosyltransferase family 1 protein [Rhodotorula toruloides]|uniref:Sterol 3-beta-glucosyltransferase n=1 Tax=Rhodotorula toruloides TaxID=5286 RepID=A0A511KNU0_RHOTO|nr:sterol 3-beta-glucosyltransferase, glycosyltransferase family 1 protein [Rhodotorula toruloides]
MAHPLGKPSGPDATSATPPRASSPGASAAYADHSMSPHKTSGPSHASQPHAFGGAPMDDLSGWGNSAERFGGMAQAGLRQEDGTFVHSGTTAGSSGSEGAPGIRTPLSRQLSSSSASSSSSLASSSSSSSASGFNTTAEVSDPEEDAGAGIGGAGYGRMAATSLDEHTARKTREDHEMERWRGGASQSYHGGMGQGYLRMIHALAQEDAEEQRKERREARKKRKAKKHHRASHSAGEAGGDEKKKEEEEGSDTGGESDADLSKFRSPPERAAANPSLARCEIESPKLTVSAAQRQLLSGTATSASSHARRHRPNIRAGGRDGEDLSKSSIFAIHRPIAAERRQTMSSTHGTDDEGGEPDLAEQDEEYKDEGVKLRRAGKEEGKRPKMGDRTETSATEKTIETMERRQKLAEKLMDVFGLEEPEEVVAEYACWLFRSILLQGFLYITAGHLCFYAYLSQKEGATIRSGSLSVRGSRTRRYRKHWFVLKDSVLSWFPSSTDPYFPDGHIDLHYCVAVEPSTKHSHHFKVSTSEKRYHFSADSEASRDEWVKAIKKVVFRCQNEGESVKIAIPLETIVDVEKSSSLEFAETIRVRVYDADEGYSIDEYWLSYFKNIDGALEKINSVLEAFRSHHPSSQGTKEPLPPSAAHVQEVEDTTRAAQADLGESDQYRQAESEHQPRRSEDSAMSLDDDSKRSKSLGQRVTSVLSQTTRLGRSSSKSSRTPASAPSSSPPGTPTKAASTPPSALRQTGAAPTLSSVSSTPASGSIATLRPSSQQQPQLGSTPPSGDIAVRGVATVTAVAATAPVPPHVGSPPKMEGDGTVPSLAPAPSQPPVSLAEEGRASSEETLGPRQHTYPPEPSTGPPPSDSSGNRRNSTLSKILSAPAGAASSFGQGGRKILEVVTRSSVPGRKKGSKKGAVAEAAITEEPEDMVAEEEDKGKHVDEFRKLFGLSEKEELLEEYPAYLFRGLPIYGRVYISSSFFCFRSSGILPGKSKMLLPLNDIIGVSKHRSYRIGFSGLMVVIKGHEEVFFEMNSTQRRDNCLEKLDQQREVVKQKHREQSKQDDDDSEEHRQLQDLLDLSASKAGESVPDLPHPRSEAVPGQPPIMFSSTTSDFVTFQPEKPLRFTCLTIGSRGDVQPYIALCKGLMAQGHHCKIASHAEYRKWVEGHGIDFSPVGGDPAELMQLMISHDFFTISFMKEAVGRFRGWLDDLLASAWDGCQDTDVLIESPSAIAGYHIAEALRIPYYRAFTMPWTRTRAYPHAFAVPEVHMGGGYNYMTYTMFDQVFWRATAGQVNRWRKETLKLRSTSLEAMQQHKIPFLYNFSPVVIPPPLDWRENIHVTGYWWLDNPDDSKSKKWEPPKELLDFLGDAEKSGKKVVFIGFGSIIIPDPLEMTRVIAEAVEKAEVYAIVAKGWSDRASKKEESKEEKEEEEEAEKQHHNLLDKPFIFNVKSIPHDWLFPRIHAAVHHGGAGTTGASLRAGLPTIIKPFFGDQHFYADRVATLGIGTHIRNFNVDNFTEALKKAVGDEKQIERARLAGEEIRKARFYEDGVATAIECIYRDLEYARSLIPAPAPVDKDADVSDSSSTSSGDEDAPDAIDEKKSASDEKPVVAASTPSTPVKSAHETPVAKDSPPGTESRTTSSDEGWDVMSRGSAAGSTWDDTISRASSATRAPCSGNEQGGLEHDQGEGEPSVEEEPQSGLTARMLGFLGKPIQPGKKEA